VDQTLQSLIHLTGFSEHDRYVLQENAEHTQQWVDEFVQLFYDTIFMYPPTRGVFKEGERPEREQSMRIWYLQITSGEFDDQFWQKQRQIGLKHVNRGILNAFMLGMMNRTQHFFLDKCLNTFGPEKGIEVFNAFKRVTDVTAGLIAKGYQSPYAVLRVR
jgi:hypothetical protein